MAKDPVRGPAGPYEPEQETGDEPAGDRAAPGSADAAASLRAEAAESRERSLRLAAELENFRRRSARELDTARRYAVEGFAAELLPVVDSLELALESAAGAPEALREGVEMTLKLLRETLARHHIEPVAPTVGEPFDPEWHEAMATQPSATVRPDTVLTLVQKGYRLRDRLLRPARVIVAREPDSGA